MQVHKVLRQHDIRPDRTLGQNFLVDPVILTKIAQSAEIDRSDVALEIGAGTGALTTLLARDAGHVIALEIDDRMIPILQSELAAFDNTSVVHGDILALDPPAVVREHAPPQPASHLRYQVVGNLPYYITSAILRRILEASPRPERIVVTVQREVAQRIVAQPGDMSVLAVSVQFYGDPELLFSIKPGSFYPSPDVESAVLRIDVRPASPLPDDQIDAFFTVVRAGFSQRRKQLHNALSAGLGQRISKDEAAARLKSASVDPRRRAQSLSVQEWIDVTSALRDVVDD